MRRFPLISGPSILWSAIAPYEAQAQHNHSQSLQRLAERGGLSPEEAWCVMHNVGLFGPEWKTAKEHGLAFVQELVRAENVNVEKYKQLVEAFTDLVNQIDSSRVCHFGTHLGREMQFSEDQIKYWRNALDGIKEGK